MAPDDRNKPPKGKPTAPRDRDVFVPKRATAPYGVPSMTPPPKTENWETPDTGTHDTRARDTGRDDNTPVGLEAPEMRDAEAEFRARNRIKETNANVKAVKVATETASIGVTTLRTEMIGHVERLDKSIGEVKSELRSETFKQSQKIDDLGDHVLNAMGTVNQAVVELNRFQGLVVKGEIDKSHTTFEVGARDQADKKKQRRSFWYSFGGVVLKVLAAAGAVGATAIATHFVERC
jgi:hypothetical protein